MSFRRLPWHWLAPALLALGLYALTLGGTFVYDDLWSCQADERLHHPSMWGQFWNQGYMPDGADNLWRPLVSLSYAIQAWGNGDHPWAFHLVNILLHATACALVAALAARLCGKMVGVVAGLLFATHPVHVEAVAEIVGRAEEMALIGIFAGLLLFIGKDLTRKSALAIVGWFLFAAFSKEQGVLLPLYLLVWYWLSRWPEPEDSPQPTAADVNPASVGILNYSQPAPKQITESQQAGRLLAALLTISMAAYITYRNHILPWFWDRSFLDPAINPLVKSVGMDRWLIPVAIAGRYAMLLVFPYRLSIDYGMDVFTPHVNFDEPWFYIGMVAIVVVIAAFIIAWRRGNRTAMFCLIAFAASYVMVSNFAFTIGTIMGDRLMYLPSAFVCILIAMILPKPTTKHGAVILAVLLTLASLRTVMYAWEWNNRKRLYTYAVATEPKASMPYLLLAGEVDYPQADALLAKAREEAPDAPQVWGKSAWCKIGLGQLDAAEKFARRSFLLRPGNSDALGAMTKIGELRAAATKPTSKSR